MTALTINVNTIKNMRRERNPSERFATTSSSAQEYVIARRHLMGNRSSQVQKLREQKLSNTRTNLSLGHDEVLYQSDAMERQKDILKGGPINPNRAKELRAMKLALQKTNYNMGHEKLDYTRASEVPDPTGHIHEYTGVLNDEVKKMIRASSLPVGHEETCFETTSGAQFQAKALPGSTEAYEKKQIEIAKMKKGLRATSFNMGHDAVPYCTQYQDTFSGRQLVGMSPEALNAASIESRKLKQDLRACHFLLGRDPPVTETTQQAQFGEYDLEENNKAKAMEAAWAKEMKKELQRSNIHIGGNDAFL